MPQTIGAFPKGRHVKLSALARLAPLALVAALATSALGCAAAPPAPPAAPAAAEPTAPAAPSAAVKAPGEAKVGDKSLCPVSKEEFTITASSPKVEHEGKTYYFCCSGCDAKFKKDPKKYLGGGAT